MGHGVQGNKHAWVRRVWPDSQTLQQCRSRRLVLVARDEAESVNSTSRYIHVRWHADCATAAPIVMAIIIALKKNGSAVSSFVASRACSYWRYAATP